VLARAAATGNLSVALGSRAEGIITDATGRVTGVHLVGGVGGSRWRRTVGAQDVVVAAGAVESARLLLASGSEQETAWATTATRWAATCRGTCTAGRSGSSTRWSTT
jgi:choline dehydrogenase-like flavoprotein